MAIRCLLLVIVAMIVAFGARFFVGTFNLNRKSATEYERGIVHDQMVDGRRELSTPWAMMWREGGGVIEWSASVSADPDKPPLTIMLRQSSRFGDEVQNKTLGLNIGGKRSQHPWLRVGKEVRGGEDWWIAAAKGTRADLQALAAAEFILVDIGGDPYSLDKQVLVNCRELLRRSKDLPAQ